MAKPETIRVELSAADRRLLQRVVDALEGKAKYPTRKGSFDVDSAGKVRLTEPERQRLRTEIANGHVPIMSPESGVETNPTLFQRLTGNVPPVEPDGDPDITYALTEKGQKWLRKNG